MIAADIDEFERGVAELDGLLAVHDLIRDHHVSQQRVLLFQFEQALLCPPVRDEGCAELLERLPARDVVVVMMAVDNVFDWLVGDSLDGIDIGLGRTQIRYWIGGDDALRRHDEHRLMVAVTENIDVIGAIHLLGGSCRRILRSGRSGHDGQAKKNCDRPDCLHEYPPLEVSSFCQNSIWRAPLSPKAQTSVRPSYSVTSGLFDHH